MWVCNKRNVYLLIPHDDLLQSVEEIRLKIFGSSVHLTCDTMNNTLVRLILASIVLIWAGSVESRTCNLGDPALAEGKLHHFRARAAHSQQQYVVKTGALDFLCKFFDQCASWSSVIPSQPNQRFSSVPVHSVASCAHNFRTLPLTCQSLRDAQTLALRSEGK